MREVKTRKVDFSLNLQMANELVLLKQYSIPTSITVADGTGLEKGAILVLSDPNTGAAATDVTVAAAFAGIVAAEKIASDGFTKVAIHKNGEFKASLSGAIVAGQPVIVVLSGATYPNYVQSGAGQAILSGAQIMGVSLETGTNGDTIRIRIGE